MTRRRLIAAAAVVAAVPAAPAGAQVHVDHDSPTGKEYAIPLESARREASSGANGSTDIQSQTGDATTSAPAPLFGQGIGDSPKASHRGGQPTSRGKRSTSGGATVDTAIAGTHTVRATVPGGDAKSTLTIGALALSVLLLGGVIGSIARRRQS
jgi:hypothetical protein